MMGRDDASRESGGRPSWAGQAAGGKQRFGLGSNREGEWKEVASENAVVFSCPFVAQAVYISSTV